MPSGLREETSRRAFRGRNPRTIQGAAGPQAVGTHDPLHALGLILGVAAGCAPEAPTNESGRGGRYEFGGYPVIKKRLPAAGSLQDRSERSISNSKMALSAHLARRGIS